MSTAAASATSASLPVWDLTDLYPGRESKELKADLARSREQGAAFAKAYAGRVEFLEAEELAEAIKTYEALEDLLGRLHSYADLVYASNMTDGGNGRFYQSIQEHVNDVASDILFFTLALNRMEDVVLETRCQESKALAHYRPWLRNIRAMRPYQLDDQLEKLLLEKHVTGRGAFNRLFDETLAGLKFSLDGREMTSEEVLDLLSSPEETKRRAAAKELGRVFGDNIRLFAFITNTLAKDKSIEDDWRQFPRPISSRNVANLVEDEVVDALITAVRDAYPRLSHAYYQWKAGKLGKKVMPYWDRNAPLPGSDDKRYGWEEARDLVLDAYGGFSPRLRKEGAKFFDNAWIDVPVRPGKAPGAFAHPTVPSSHPYLLLNFQGKSRDVMTLAHELGHGVHQLLAAPRGALMADTPLTLAETASVFGEQLTFREMLKQESGKARRQHLIASKVEDMLNTVVRQVAFCEFERQVHGERQNGELSPERIGEIWLGVQRESLGPALQFDEEYQYYWSHIPHFIHSPFYVYAYAFGDCLVNALYACYLDGMEGFTDKYFAMLAAGGTLHHRELLAPFGLDASDPAFWSKGLDVIADFIGQLS